jgi:type IV secretory pathway TraG/TraD family ATPase VirD4
LFFAVLLEQVAGEEVPTGVQGVPITMMLDEFANIGTIPALRRQLALPEGAALLYG